MAENIASLLGLGFNLMSMKQCRRESLVVVVIVHKKIESFSVGLLISGDIRGICQAPRLCSLTFIKN